MKDEKDDIFKEAARMSLRPELPDNASAQEIKEELIVTDEDQDALALMQTMEGDKWDNLAKYVSGDGAHRLLTELKGMSSRDFVRNYLKLLEHFKPKLVRSDSSPDGDIDRTIQVELVQQLPGGEIRTVSINKTETNIKKDG